MADDKRYLPDSLPGVPKVTPETIRAYKNRPHDFEKEFRILQRENPVVAQELMVTAELTANEIIQKQAFAEGALFMYSLVSLSIHAKRLGELFGPRASDGADDEDQQPSA